MPMFKVACECGYRGEKYLHREFDRQCLHSCRAGEVGEDGTVNRHNACGKFLTFLPSYGVPLTYYEESRPRTIWNMADEPVTVTSPKQHEQMMKKHGVSLAPQRRGMPGCWS